MNPTEKIIIGKNLINGQLIDAASSETFDVLNPATNTIIGKAPASQLDDINVAVASAKAAQASWAKTPAKVRGQLLLQIAQVFRANKESLAQLMAIETGKAIRTECRPELDVLPEAFEFYAGLALELKGETIPFDPSILTYTLREPIGVVGAIIPWNVPLMLMAFKVCPAIICGNTVVLKSAEQSPLITLEAIKIINEILPPGVCNLISGDGPATGAGLVKHPDVAKVTFTGSVASGRQVYQSAATRLIPTTLELGGKSPMIICQDADINAAIEGANIGMRFTRQGQSCSAASRIFVHESFHDALIEGLVNKLNTLTVGDPLDDTTDIGSMISEEQFNTVQKYIQIGIDSGATPHACSSLPSDPKFKNGFFHQPTIFTNVNNSDTIAQEEIFGPVTSIIKFKNFEDAISQANDSSFGLAGSIWTQNLKTALIGVHSLQSGFVQVNQSLVVRPGLSYGGYKNSGLGHEASLESTLEHFTQKKTVLVNLS